MSRIWQDLRYAARSLARSPQFVLVSATTLALAIGTNAAVFSVVNGILLKPLPYPAGDRLVVVSSTAPGLGYDNFGLSPGVYFQYRQHGADFEDTGIYINASVNLTGDGTTPERVGGLRVSRTMFSTLGVRPALGRVFSAAEDQPGGPHVVLLSDGLWRERYGADRSIVGRAIRVDGEPHTVVGVMPPDFKFPTGQARLWLPIALDSTTRDVGSFGYGAVARLRPGTTPAMAQAHLQPLVARLREDYQDVRDFQAFLDAGRYAPVVRSMKEQLVGNSRSPLLILLGTVAFVFLIGCANVTNLFLVRSESRQKEMAVRAALGAGRGGLVGNYLAESALLSLVGGALGLALSYAGLPLLVHAAPPGIPRIDAVGIDPVVVGFTLGVTALAAVLLGILPALRLASSDLLASLSKGVRGSTAGRERHRARQLLVVAQTAMALVLLVGAGLMVQSFQKLRGLDPGFDPHNVLIFHLSLPAATFNSAERAAVFDDRLLARLRALPGVQVAGAVAAIPPVRSASGTAHRIEDHPVEAGQLPPMLWYTAASAGYFQAMHIPLLAGRTFDAPGSQRDLRAVIISQLLARRFWPGQSAIGKRLGPSGDSIWHTVVGVVGDVRDRGLEQEPAGLVYYPLSSARDDTISAPVLNLSFAVRTPTPQAIAPAVRQQVWALDPNLPIAGMQTLEKAVSDSLVRRSFTMMALLVASIIALVLGAIGLYGVISYIVTQRTREIGVRLALGAEAKAVRRMVVLQGARLVGGGLVVGCLGALALTRLLQSMLYGISSWDPLTFVAVSLVLAAVGLTASYLPARRASRIDPARSLQLE